MYNLFFKHLGNLRFIDVLYILIFLFVVNSKAFSQQEKTLCELSVKGIRPERFMLGQKLQEIDSTALARNSFNNLSDFLQFQSPIAIKSYGAGQVTTISFRGTASTHTALLWNGININFPSLGLTDYSTIPVSGFDQMSIQYGSAASSVGSDAVGGSIQLRSIPTFRNEGTFAIKMESSKNFGAQIGLRYFRKINNNWSFSGKTLLYGSNNKNDFGTKDRVSRKGQVYGIEPIETKQNGMVQDLYLQKKNGDLLSLNLWITNNDLKIQPNIISLREITLTQAYRLLASYQLGKTLFRAGLIKDITDFGKAENTNPSRTEIDRYIARVEHDFSWIRNCNRGTYLKIGAEAVHIDAKVDGYGDEIKSENRFDLYALLRMQFSDRLSSSLNLRQAFITKYNPPFTPSFGIEYDVFKSNTTKISLPANLALSYRVPTLNERYWVNLGNPNIKPEKGFNKELGLVWKQKITEIHQTQFGISYYHNLIDQWTYWNPDNGYRVENLQQVLSKGIELDFGMQSKFSSFQLNSNISYAYSNSSQTKEFGAFSRDIIGKQLIYIPKHTISSTTNISKNSFSFTLQQSFNSKRYITFDHSGVPFSPFYLANILVNYKSKIRHQAFDTVFQINNVGNTIYPNLKKNAMPGRSVALSLILHLETYKK